MKGSRMLTNNYSIAFITPSHRPEVLEQNLMRSRIFESRELVVQRGYTSVPQAYNEAETGADIRVYLHHDVWLPDEFEKDLVNSINEVERVDPNWGVLGVAGVILTDTGLERYGFLNDRGQQLGSPENLPHVVDTLDELMLIVKDKGLRFDENIPSAHFYGADICMQAKLKGKKNYVINAFCHHNSGLQASHEKNLPKDFFEAKDYIRKKYIDALPIATTCIIINKDERTASGQQETWGSIISSCLFKKTRLNALEIAFRKKVIRPIKGFIINKPE